MCFLSAENGDCPALSLLAIANSKSSSGRTKIASGKISASEVLHSFVQWKSILAIVVGVAVSWLGGRGVSLMVHQPSVVAGLLVGTVLGVALFKGVPVGPLIAAGLLSLVIGKS